VLCLCPLRLIDGGGVRALQAGLCLQVQPERFRHEQEAVPAPVRSLLFEVVCRRYERGSIVLTSNKSYGDWGEVFSGDTVIATAILDRLLHHSTTIPIKGESYRLKDRKKAGIVTTPAG